VNKLKALSVYFEKRVLIILFLGFSSGLPLALTASTLDVWLTREGISLHSIGLFAAVSTPYALKFLWAPLVDSLRIPILGRLGRRRSWMVATQIALMLSIIGLGLSNPAENVTVTAIFALLTAFFSASQDIVIDAYRVQSLLERDQGAGAANAIFGYRLGMLVSGAGALYLVRFFGLSWHVTYMIMAVLLLIGVVTILLAPEPGEKTATLQNTQSWFARTIIAPFADFAKRPGWVLILLFIILFKLGDALAGKMTNPFLIQTGFNEIEIANVVKLYGLVATLLGTFAGGAIVYRIGIIRGLWLGGILQMVSNFMFSFQAMVGHSVPFLSLTIGIENFCSGIGGIVLVAYLSSLCNVAYAATQYALLSSLAVVGRTGISAFSGFLAERFGWIEYFMLTAAAALPALVILFFVGRRDGAAKN